MVNAHHTAIDNHYLSNDNRSPMELDHREAADNQSLNCCSSSNCNNDTFLTFEAPPPPACKKVAEKVKQDNKSAKNKRKAITSSNNDGKDMAYAQPFMVSAKSLEEPLAFSLESNCRYAPVDGTLSLGNSLNVKDIRPEPAIVPGNAPKELNCSNNVCTQHHHWHKCTSLNDDSSNDQSIQAYSLSKEKLETSELIESPPIKLPNKKHRTPTSIAVVDTISPVRSHTLLKVLFDQRSTSTLISHKFLPRHCKPCAITNEHQIHTHAGTCSAKHMVVMRKIRLP
jgi:hypothetical protein